MSESSYLGSIETLAASRRGRIGSATVGLLIGCALLALLVAAWVVVLTVGGSELDRADARLASEARGATAEFSGRVAVADARAGTLAARPALQRAVLRRDRRTVRRLVGARSDIAVYAGRRLLFGSVPPGAVTRSVAVVSHGRSVGRVVGVIALNQLLIGRLSRAADIQRPDHLSVRAGPGARDETVGRAFERTTDRRYRVFATRLVGAPSPVVLEVMTPRSPITSRAHRRALWLILATLVSLATLTVGVLGLYRLTRPGRRLSPRRRDVRQVLALVGDALASTHDPERLLPVILHASMEATGAVAGEAVRNGDVVAREGTFAETGPPLRLDLSGDVVDEELALVLHPGPGGFDERTVALAHTLVAQAAIALENARLHGIVKRQAVTDELTGLANRRSFRESLENELLRAERFGNPLSVIVADLDDFKTVNDRFGHQTGDLVLAAFAEVLRNRIRTVDLAARLGGEEFAILLPGTDVPGAEALGENLRAAVADLAVPVGESEIRLTASFGVAAYPQTHTADELLSAADLALYSAKRQGKDRVVTVDPEAN